MRVIIIADINSHTQESKEHQHAIVDLVSRYVKQKAADVEILHATSFREVVEIFRTHDVLLLVTNFPPDSTYVKDYRAELSPRYGGLLYVSKADSYSRTKEELHQILSADPVPRILVITGAPRHILTDEEIVNLSSSCSIRVVRKADLFTSYEGYEQAYASLVLDSVARSLQSNTARNEWQDIQLQWSREQLGAVRVLVLGRRQQIADSLWRGLDLCFTEIASPLAFVTATSIESAHNLLLDQQFEVMLTVFDADYWMPLYEATQAQHALTTFAFVLEQSSNPPALSDRAAVVRTNQNGMINVQDVAIAILRVLRNVRQRLVGSDGIRVLQREFLNCLTSEDPQAFERALRVLTGHHRSAMNALSSSDDNLQLFIPVATPEDFETILRKSLFICDRAVFTQLPISQAKQLEGEMIEVIPLWNVGGATYCSVIPYEVGKIIKRYAPMFADGRTVFFPSPTLIHVSQRNVEEIMPEAKRILDDRPDFPIWQESRAFEHYISADKIGAGHVVIEEYKPMSMIGKAVATIEIPYVANVTADLLNKLLSEHQESLVAFRSHTKRVIDDLIESGSDIESANIRKRFVRDIEDGVKELEGKLSLLRKSQAIQQAGGLIVTAVSTLAAVSMLDISTVAAKLLGGGGLGSMAFQYLSYLMQVKAHKNSPYHIIWQLKRRGTTHPQ